MPPRKKPEQVVADPVAAAGQLEQVVTAPDSVDLEPGTVFMEHDDPRLTAGEASLGMTPEPGLLQRTHEMRQDTATGTQAEMLCALGHANAPGTRFCGECGLAMDAPAPVKADLEAARPRPASQLTAEERTERDRQHAEAIAAARQFENAPVTYQPSEGETVLIHFIEDGLTFAGQVWYRGQEIEIGPSHPRWEQAREWILLDRYGQVERWGKHYFERGPWPGRRSYLDGAGSFEQLATEDKKGRFAGPGEQALRQADEAERRRGRAVPAPMR
jgi:hypothetical protein